MLFSILMAIMPVADTTGKVEQTATASSVVDGSAPCELHVWPAERMTGLPFYTAFGFIVVEGRAEGSTIDANMRDLLSPSAQLDALSDEDFRSRLPIVNTTKVIRHAEPLDPKTLNKVKFRRTPSVSPCYSEIVITRHMLVEDIVWGDRFMSGFMFRKFNDGFQPSLIKKGVGGNKLKVLTVEEKSRPSDAPQLVQNAIRANFFEFAKNMR